MMNSKIKVIFFITTIGLPLMIFLWWYQSTMITKSLNVSIMEDNFDLAEKSVRHGICLNYWWRRNTGVLSPLAMAVKAERERIAEFLLDYGADPNVSGFPKYTILSKAIIHGMRDIAESLIARGADVNAIDEKGFYPLHYAIIYLPSFAHFLIENGADINSRSCFQQTPLHLAACYGRKEIVSILLEKGVDVNYIDQWGCTPLHYSLSYPDIMEKLLQKGSDPNAKCDMVGQSSIYLSIWLPGWDQIITKDRFGWTALHYCYAIGYKESAQILIKWGAMLDICDKAGRSPLDIAEIEKRECFLQ